MRVENSEIKITIPIPVGEPDGNGVIYTKEAVENAVSNLRKNIPILWRENIDTGSKVVGYIISDSRELNFDEENQVYNLTVDGLLFYSGADITVNEIDDGRVSSFEINSVGITI